MQIAVLTFDGFNELDSFVAAAILNRLRGQGWSAQIAAPTPQVTSMHGVTLDRQQPLDFAADTDAVIIGSAIRTSETAADPALRGRLRLEPARPPVRAPCWGTRRVGRPGRGGRRSSRTSP